MSEGRYILLVEDNPDDVILTRLALEKNRIENKVVIAEHGEEALDYLFCRGKFTGRDPEDRPAVILLDLKLPLVDGLEVLRQIRRDQRTTLIPVIALTSSSMDTDQAECLRLGVSSYVRKPTSLIQFVDIIQQIRSEWLDCDGSASR
jgi:two-component system response regulator